MVSPVHLQFAVVGLSVSTIPPRVRLLVVADAPIRRGTFRRLNGGHRDPSA